MSSSPHRYIYHFDTITFNTIQSKLFLLSDEIHFNHFGKAVKLSLAVKDLILHLKDVNHGGFQSLYAIPATIGGLIVNNASDNLVCFSSFLVKVMVIDENNKIKILNKDELGLTYRNSIFKEKKYIILYVLIKVENVKKEIILNDIKKAIVYRNMHQGSYKYSCGSLFKNSSNFKAYEIIKSLNLDKISLNDLHFSEIHCNILVNDYYATCKDVILLVKLIKEKAKKVYNIDLFEELIIY